MKSEGPEGIAAMPGSMGAAGWRFGARVVQVGSTSGPAGCPPADAELIDLADPAAAAWDGVRRTPMLLVRVRALASGHVERDLARAMPWRPAAVVLPGAVGRHDVAHLAAKLAVAEAEIGLADRETGILAQPADTAAGILALASLAGGSPRLRAAIWHPDALAAALGRTATPALLDHARTTLLLAAHAAGIPALHWLGRRSGAMAAACAGFDGGLAVSPGDLATLRTAFSTDP